MTTMPENLNMDWVDSVKVDFVTIYQLTIFGMNFICKLEFLIFVHDFSMFLSTLLREHHGHILSFVKLHLYGTTSMQVPENVFILLVNDSVMELRFLFHPLSILSITISMISDIEFGRLQARDLLQHLWTGPISNASVDVVQGGRSVEVRAVGVTKVHAF